MKIIVTGAAGFIGSHLCEKLLEDERNTVVGIDGWIGPTPSHVKTSNTGPLLAHSRFTLISENLLVAPLHELLRDADAIYHLAGMPGVRTSWGNDFEAYAIHNISVTQRLLEACKNTRIQQFIYASTSSVYGEKDGKLSEGMEPAPLSPYGITKLTGEHLCRVYYTTFGIPTTVLRYFTVYGPRQRPDMSFHRFIKQLLANEPITIFGDGTQSRDFTYISDCIDGTAAVLGNQATIGKTINIGGKEKASVNDVIALLEELTGKKAVRQYTTSAIGEPKHTWADLSLAEKYLHYCPKVTLKEGIAREIEYIRMLYREEEQ